MKQLLSAGLELVGFACLIYGAWLVTPWLAWIIGGFILLLIGNALAPSDRSPE